MKPLLCYDESKKADAEKLTGGEFIVDKIPAELEQALNKSTNAAVKRMVKNMAPAFIMCALKYILFAVTIILVLTAATKIIDNEITLSSLLSENLWIAVAALAALIAAIIMSVVAKRLMNKDDGVEGLNEDTTHDSLVNQAWNYYRIPSSAKDITVLCLSFEAKRSKTVFTDTEESGTISTDYKAYVENDTLYLIDVEGKYAFQKSELLGLSKVNKKLSIWWLEDQPIDDALCKRYDMKKKDEDIFIKYFISLNILRGGEEYCLCFPPYELPKLEELTGLKLV